MKTNKDIVGIQTTLNIKKLNEGGEAEEGVERRPYFNDEEILDLHLLVTETMELFLECNPTIIAEPAFEDLLEEGITAHLHEHFNHDPCYDDEAKEETESMIATVTAELFRHHLPPRSYEDSILIRHPDKEAVSKRLDELRAKPQPAQRTKEWYEYRYHLITASNAYKAFESQCMVNQLIYEKCKPLLTGGEGEKEGEGDKEKGEKERPVSMVNVNSTLHWGQKYEPLSVKIYEHLYETKVEDFGCIRHEDDRFAFLGASPDGINVEPTSWRYGRMLEIKNIVNREINGIPKKEYWIQTQLQMEVCNLNECDFLETKFVEYPDRETYLLDHASNDVELVNCNREGNLTGQIIYFHTKEGKPHYEYRPLTFTCQKEADEWHEKTVDYYQSSPYHYTFMQTLYWKLEKISCVLIARNRMWFQLNVPVLAEVWKIILKERQTGYEHRAPNRRAKKAEPPPAITMNSFASSNCWMNVVKLE